MGKEIEYKWIPENQLAKRIMALTTPVRIEQGYLCYDPVMRVRRHGNEYYMTYKGKGMEVREEYNLPLNKEAFELLLPKCEGRIIKKDRYTLPVSALFPGLEKESKGPEGELMLELDVFSDELEGLVYLEVEFATERDMKNFVPPVEFGKNVTFDPTCSNAALSRR